MNQCPYCGKEYPNDAVVCPHDQSPLVAGVSGPDSPTSPGQPAKPTTVCPACGALDDYKPAVELSGSFSLLVFLVGGLFAVLFHNAGRHRRVQCNKCGALFNLRTPVSRVSRVIFWLLVAPMLIGIVLFLIFLLHTFFAR
jgi:hypothetical protein